MNLAMLRHLVLKDVRHQWTRLALVWLIAGIVPLTNFFEDMHLLVLLSVVKIGLVIVFYILLSFCFISAILLDPTCGSSRFLKTRPVPWQMLVASKALFIFLFLYLPLFIFRLSTIWTSGVHLSLADQSLCLLELAIMASGIVAPFVLPSLFFQRLATVLMVIAGGALGIYALVIFVAALGAACGITTTDMQAYGFFLPTDPETRTSTMINGFLLACLVLEVTLLPVAILRYWRPSVPIPCTLACSTAIVAAVYFFFPPVFIDQYFSDVNYTDPGNLPPPLRDQVHFHLDDLTWDASRSWDDSENAKKRLESHLIEKVTVAAIPGPLIVMEDGNRTTINLASGKTLFPEQTNNAINNSYENQVRDFLRWQCAGIVPQPPDHGDYKLTRTMTFNGHDENHPRPDLTEAALAGATIRGNISLRIARIQILKIMPFRAGLRYDSLRTCFEVRHVAEDSGVIRYLRNESIVPLLLRGDFERLLRSDLEGGATPYVVINRKTGEILDNNVATSNDDPFGPSLAWMTLSRERPNPAAQTEPPPPLPTGWLDDATICFYTTEYLGAVAFSYKSPVSSFIH